MPRMVLLRVSPGRGSSRSDLLELDEHLGVDEVAVDRERLNREELARATVARPSSACDGRRPREAEHANRLADPCGVFTLGGPPGEPADDLRRFPPCRVSRSEVDGRP